jgi:hypothetical protein
MTEPQKRDFRVEFFCRRYMDHNASEIKEKSLAKETIEWMVELFDRFTKGKKRAKEELTKRAEHVIRVRDEARSVLKWSYPYAYMLEEGSSALRLFEFVQKECEVAVEKLCWALERRKGCTADRVMSLTTVVEKNTEVMLKHVDQYSQFMAG